MIDCLTVRLPVKLRTPAENVTETPVNKSKDMKTILLCLRGFSIIDRDQNVDVVLNALVRGNPLDDTPDLWLGAPVGRGRLFSPVQLGLS
jgi:hypothetical protein